MESTKKGRCPACNNSQADSKGEKNGFLVYRCKDCRTLYTLHLDEKVAAYDYDVYYTDKNLSVPQFVHQRADEVIGTFAAYRTNGRLLDVGCGAGVLLQAAMRAKWDAEGLEVSPPAVAFLRSAGCKVKCGYLESVGYPAGSFDVVVASGVLEHIPNVERFTREIGRVLRPGGLFYATTPNGDGISARLLGIKWSVVAPPEHLHLYSISGIRTFLTSCGIIPLKVAAESVNPFEIVHVLRGLARGKSGNKKAFDRVESSYAFNQAFTKSSLRRLTKKCINHALSASGYGDELKIYSVKKA